MANNSENYIDLKIINDKQLLELFSELQNKIQNNIVLAGMRKGGKIILDAAKANFKTLRKGKSLTDYSNFNSSFKMDSIKNPKNGFGLKIGVKNYKYRFINTGTKDRSFKSSGGFLRKSVIHKTGKIEGNDFFNKAVEAKQEEAVKYLQQAVVDSLNRTVKKLNKS